MKELSRLVHRSFHIIPRQEDFRPLALGASGRTIVRIHFGGRTCIGIQWGNDRADNDSFIPAARHLHAHGVNVPEIYDYEPLGPGCGAALVEDLGDANLLAFRKSPGLPCACATSGLWNNSICFTPARFRRNSPSSPLLTRPCTAGSSPILLNISWGPTWGWKQIPS